MKSITNQELFTEITAEEASAINGGGWGRIVIKLVFIAGKWVWTQVRK
jgi:hypothetical protein